MVWKFLEDVISNFFITISAKKWWYFINLNFFMLETEGSREK